MKRFVIHFTFASHDKDWKPVRGKWVSRERGTKKLIYKDWWVSGFGFHVKLIVFYQ